MKHRQIENHTAIREEKRKLTKTGGFMSIIITVVLLLMKKLLFGGIYTHILNVNVVIIPN